MTVGARFEGVRQNASFSRFLAIYVGYSTLFWEPGKIFVASDPRFMVSGPPSKLVVFAFLDVYVGYSTLFWVLEMFFVASDRGTRFQDQRQNSSFSCFLAGFVGYNTLFWVPATIFGARHPWFTVLGLTSKLIVFAFSGRFRGL